MADSIKIRAREVDGQVSLKSVIMHPMETGQRKVRKTGKKIPPHYIRELAVSLNGVIVMEGYWGRSVSRNPYLALEFPGRKGDLVTITWLDNRGYTDKAYTRVR